MSQGYCCRRTADCGLHRRYHHRHHHHQNLIRKMPQCQLLRSSSQRNTKFAWWQRIAVTWLVVWTFAPQQAAASVCCNENDDYCCTSGDVPLYQCSLHTVSDLDSISCGSRSLSGTIPSVLGSITSIDGNFAFSNNEVRYCSAFAGLFLFVKM